MWFIKINFHLRIFEIIFKITFIKVSICFVWLKVCITPPLTKKTTRSLKCLIGWTIISGIYSNSKLFSAGIKNSFRPCLFADKTEGNNPLILLTLPSNPNSQKKSPLFKLSSWYSLVSKVKIKRERAMGRSNQVPTFLISLGARLRINFLFGNSIPQFLKVPLILSFDSLIVISGSPIISIHGNDLLLSASMVISCPISPRFVNVLMNCTIFKSQSKTLTDDIKMLSKKSSYFLIFWF